MLGYRRDVNQLNANGQSQYKILEDISTRTLESVSIGEEAGKISKGEGNAFVGYQAGKQNTFGSFGVFVGFQAGQLSQNGDYNTFVGAFSGRENNRGFRNTFVGFQAGQLNKDGSDCTGVGAYALRENTTGLRNVAVGNRAGERILDGDNNTMIGMEAGQDIRSGNNNTMAGYRSGRASFRNNENTYFGAYAGHSNSYGDGNAFVGYRAGQNLRQGNFNVAVGTYALSDAQYGDCNIAIGAFAGTITTGCNNVYVGSGAGSTNQNGNNNTLVGNNAGFESQGSDNVYIGKDAAYSLSGNKNVVIGVQAYQDIQSSASVIIGYRAGNNIFDFGNSNILIGINADTYTARTSNAIVIGSKNTKAYNNSISIGENIDNGGQNAVSLGYDINVDGDKTIIVGNQIDIKGVNVFNDPLNYRFPVRNTQNYDKFNLLENYTDTLFLKGVSNEVAIATLNTTNRNDSYLNIEKGNTLPSNINLLNVFTYNVLYQGRGLFYDGITANTFNITDYFLNPNSNNFTTTAFNKSNLFLNSSNQLIDYGTFDIFNMVNTSNDSYNITIDGNQLPFLLNASLSSNLIPYRTPSPLFYYTFDILKRNAIYKTVQNSNYYTLFQDPVIINTTSNKTLQTGEVDNLPGISYDQFEYVDTEPLYGNYNSNTKIYQNYTGAYFTSNDRLKIGIVNKITNGLNTYYIGACNQEIYSHFITYNSNYSVYRNSNIYLFPNITTVFDRSYFHIHPSSNVYINVYNNDASNLHLSINNIVGESFSNVLFNNSNLNLTRFNSSNFEPLYITEGYNTYLFNIIYLSNLQTPLVSRDNLSITVMPNKIQVPYSTSSFRYPTQLTDMAVINYPSYGTIHYTSNIITYTPGIVNIDIDYFTILCKYDSNELIYYDVNVTTSNVFSKLLLTKMQEPILYNITSTIFDNSLTVSNFINYFQTFYTYSNITINYPYGDSNILTSNLITIIENYSCNLGYIYTSNDIVYSIYTPTVKPILLSIPNSNDVQSNIGNDYFIYNPYPPYNYTAHYYFSSNIPFITSNIITYSQYEVRSNNAFPYNRYYNWNYSIYSTKYYTQACNIISSTVTSNIYTYYYDLYENYIYSTSNIVVSNSGSNYTLINNTSNLIQYVSYSNLYNVSQSVTSNIPTIQLNRTHIYENNGTYQVSTSNTSNNLLFLQKNKGPIYSFHQSNINQHEIHIWNTQLSDDLHTTKVRSNIYFTDGKFIEIDYFKNNNTSLILDRPITLITTPNFINYIPEEYTFEYLDTYNYIAIQHTSNISFAYRQTVGADVIYNSITTLDPTLGDIYAIADPMYSEDGFVDYINYYVNPSTGVISYGKPIRRMITSTYLRNFKTFYKTGFSYSPTKYISSNELYYSRENPESIYYKIHSENSSFALKKNSNILAINDVFYPNDILQNKVSIDFKNSQPITDSISIEIYHDATLRDTINFEATPCNITEYFQTQSNESLATMTFLDLKNQYSQTISSPIWDSLSLLNSNINASFKITTPPQKGFLSKTNIQPITEISLSNLIHDTLYYIPYTPMQYDNDSIKGIITYNDTLSPEYTFTIKNYTSVWNDIFITQPIFNTQTLPRSLGMVADNISWSLGIYRFLSAGTSNITFNLNYNNINITTPVQYIPVTKQPHFIQSSTTISVDSGNFNSLQSILNYLNDPTQDVNFYITQPPSYGVILDNYEAKSFVSSSNIRVGNGFYQHYGSSTLPDQFVVRVGTSPYDVSVNTLTVNVNITPQPYLLKNNYQYQYFNNTSSIRNTCNILNSNILQLSDGSLYVYEQQYLNLYKSNIIANTLLPINILTKDDLDTDKIYYHPNESFFSDGSNINEPLKLKFTLNSSSNVSEQNKLVKYKEYQNLYNFEWILKINTYESVNTVALQQPTNQRIVYYNNNSNNPSSNVFRFQNKTELLFDFKPYQNIFVFPDNPIDIKNYYFTFALTDKLNPSNNLLTGIFSHSNISIFSSNNQKIELPVVNFNNSKWSTFNIVNYDPVNNNKLSIKLDDINYTSGLELTNLRLEDLKDIVIDVPVLNEFNYFNSINPINVPSSNLSIACNIYYYNLTNYNTQVHFRNFYIYVSGNIELDSSTINNENLFNIAIGDKLDVTGINNICLGKNFKTIGEGSIILGTDIGVNKIDGSTTNNEIFNSIIISNNSFRNSIVRDVIAIGNNILNETSSSDDIETFLSKRPVLIGNDITPSQLDFHINFQNTFVKTNNNIGKIYCGLQQEEVYIGYTSNNKIEGEKNTDYQLHINGGLDINGILRQTYNGVTYIKYVYGDILFNNGTIHTYTKNITWEYEQSSDYYPITIIGKFKCINNNNQYLWKRFELFISSKYDIIEQKPKLLSIVDMIGYNTSDINNFAVSILKTSSKSIAIEIYVTTSYALTESDYVTGTLDLEMIYQTILGNITITTLDDVSDSIIFNPTFRLLADKLTGDNNSIISSWNNYSTYAVGGASLPILKTNEIQRYVRFGTGILSSIVGNYIDIGTYTWPMLTNGGFTFFGIYRPYTTELYNEFAIALNLFEFGTLDNPSDNTLQLTEFYQPGIQELDFYINKPSFNNTDFAINNRYYNTRPGTEWKLYGVRIDNTVVNEHTITLYTPHSGTYTFTRTGNPDYRFNNTFVTSNNFIGKSLFSYGNYQNIDIKEALWYNKYLDDNQADEVITYLNTKYNLNRSGLFDSITLPTRINSYSLRLLYNTYKGPLLRIRRSTDNKEAEVYFDKDGNVTQVIPLNGDTALYGTNALNTYKDNGNLYVHTWFDQMYRNDLQSLNITEQPLLDTTDMYIYINNTCNTSIRLSYNDDFSLDNGTFIMDIKPMVHVDVANTQSITDWYSVDPIIAGERSGGVDDFGIVLQQGNKFCLGLGPTDGQGVYTYTNGFNVQSIMAVSRENINNSDTILLYKDGGLVDRTNRALYDSETGIKTSPNPGYVGYDTINGSRANVKLKTIMYFSEGTTVTRSTINTITRTLGNTVHNISGLVAWYDANSFDTTTNTWYDMSENNYTITSSDILGTITKEIVDDIYAICGDTTAGIIFPEEILPPTYTLFHVAKYNGTNKERIFDGLTANWLSGFSSGNSGVANHDGWLTAQTDTHGSSWMISTDQNGLYRSEKVQRSTSIGGNSSKRLTINNGYFRNNTPIQLSDWAVAEVIVYDRTLSLSDIQAVENYLDAKYNPTATPGTANIYVLFGAYNVGFYFGYNLDYSNYDRMTFTPNETDFWISSIRGLRCLTNYLTPTLESTKTTYGIDFLKPDGTAWSKGSLGSSNKFYMRIRNGSNANKIIRIQDYDSTVESGTLQADTDPGISRGEQYYFYFTISHDSNWYYLRSLYNNYAFIHNYSFIRPTNSTPQQTVDDAFLWMIV